MSGNLSLQKIFSTDNRPLISPNEISNLDHLQSLLQKLSVNLLEVPTLTHCMIFSHYLYLSVQEKGIFKVGQKLLLVAIYLLRKGFSTNFHYRSTSIPLNNYNAGQLCKLILVCVSMYVWAFTNVWACF